MNYFIFITILITSLSCSTEDDRDFRTGFSSSPEAGKDAVDIYQTNNDDLKHKVSKNSIYLSHQIAKQNTEITLHK